MFKIKFISLLTKKMSDNSPIYLDMYSFIKQDLSVETSQDKINETFYQIRQTKKKYGDKFINEIYREVFKSVNESFATHSNSETNETEKENFCHDCVILQVIRNLQHKKPIEMIKN